MQGVIKSYDPGTGDGIVIRETDFAEFDLAAGMGQALEQMTGVFSELLAAAPDAHFADCDAVAFMLATLIGGSVRMVLDTAPTPENLARLRQELPRACRAYVSAAQ